ncbi:four helix bundle protein [Phragmitibacter flavus]|uniref:Four helix bundle protein n=1 Tax=Phragmitibacter flavus TaxID=2576071 RepID=A0A5R8KD20_9BACT|nr:four helix bundle protein [Phragmitibacter flavus]TLD70183.1 four helix bundle protein [Phragmitibacter flavus]
MTSEDLKNRTMDFAVRVLKLVAALPKNVAGKTVGNQLARSGTSVAANYRAALRAKSTPDFINKITIILEEADESSFWMELTDRAELLPPGKITALRQEAEELVKIFNATRSTSKRKAASSTNSRKRPNQQS